MGQSGPCSRHHRLIFAQRNWISARGFTRSLPGKWGAQGTIFYSYRNDLILAFYFPRKCFSIIFRQQEEIQKLAAQIEFMRIVNMEMNNRHIKPKPGGYFTTIPSVQSPVGKGAQTQTSKHSTQQNSGISEDGHSGSNSLGTNSIGYVYFIWFWMNGMEWNEMGAQNLVWYQRNVWMRFTNFMFLKE